jgi:hypothetical protein
MNDPTHRGGRRRRLAIAFFIFVLVGCTASAAGAQPLQRAPQYDPALTWLTAPNARAKLLLEVGALEAQLAASTPGSAPHTDLYRRIVFHKAIYRGLVQGQTPAAAIEAALGPAATLDGREEQAFTARAVLQTLRAEAIALLTL